MNARWRIELFGGLRAEGCGRVLARFRTQKTGALLAYLAYYLRRVHSRETLIELFWPQSEPQAGRNSLSQALSWLRRQLEPPDVPPGAVLVADRASVRLNPEVVTTDVAAFKSTLRAASRAGVPASRRDAGRVPTDAAERQGQNEAARKGAEPAEKGAEAAEKGADTERAQRLAQAAALYRGPLLAGYYENWLLGERERLADLYSRALAQLITDLEAAGDARRALSYAQRAVNADPLREEAQHDLIRLLAAAGQPEGALRQYRELERLLKQELGAAPAAATRSLAREIEQLRLRSTRLRPVSRAVAAPSDGPAAAAFPDGEPGWAPAEGENRLATLLFVETSRTVAVTGDPHPEDLALLHSRMLQSIADILVTYDGQLHRFLGDRVLAVFGIPMAHEDDPTRAVRAALDIREAACGLGLDVRAGIDTGEVYVGEIGTTGRQEPTVVGPVVHQAARLLERVEPGRILVGAGTYRLTRRAFAFSRQSLAGPEAAGPVVAYAVEGALPRPEKAYGIEGMRAPLIGREAELATLREALAEVLQGRGRMVSLVGEAGVGKSRLVAELKDLSAMVGVPRLSGPPTGEEKPLERGTPVDMPLWLEGRCLELNMTKGYSLFVDLLREYFGLRPDEPESERVARLVATLRELVDRGDLSTERAEEIGPLLGNLFSLHSGPDWELRLKNASPEQIRYQTLLALQEFFVMLACRQPVVLVLEDLHWADPLSLDLISLLMESLPETSEHEGAPVLLLCVYRPEREHRCSQLTRIASRKCPEHATELALRELTPAQSQRLLQSLLGAEQLPAAVTEGILQQAQGNPFFVEEVVHALIDAGALYREGEAWQAREPTHRPTSRGGVGVPESVQSVILSRVDRLDRQLRRVLESASVMGRLFRRRLLEQVTATETGIEGALWALEEHGLIYQERVLPEEEYSFKHVLTQEAVYQSVLRRRRTLLHQKVAEAIEALDAASLEEQYEQLAYHYERSKVDEKAVTYLLKAGEKARRAYLNEEAIDYFQRALDWLDGRRRSVLAAEGTVKGAGPRPLGKTRQDWRVDALRGLGQTYCNRGKLAEAERYLREAIALGQVIRLAARELVGLYWWLTNVLFWQGRYDEEIQIAAEGQTLLGEDTESVEAALMNHNLALGYGAKGDYGRSRDFCYRNAKFLQRLPYLEELMLPVYHDLVQFYYFRDTNVEEAMRWVQLLERKAEQHHGLTTLGVAHKLRSEISLEQGDLRGAISHAQRAWERYLKVGDYTADVRILALLGWASLSLGELQGAEEYIGRWLDIAEDMGYRADVAWSNLAMGTLWLGQGSWANATEAFQKAARLCSDIGAPQEVLARLYLGRMYLAQRQRREALRQFQQAMALVKLNDQLPVEGRPLPGALSGLEEAYEDPASFRAFCCRFREEHPEVRDAPSVQWFLESTVPLTDSRPQVHDLFVAPLSSDWTWHDPFGDCSLATKSGLEIHAANGRGLGHINLSAPRLLRLASGDFTVQTVCVPVSAEKPAIGGLLFWKGRENFLRLDRGTRGAHEVSFLGCLGNKDMIFGRGRLTAERVFLRLERWGDRVNALCSADGRDWFTVGATAFPLDDPVQVGLHAIGSIDRTVYPGSYPEGTAIRFAWFQLCRARL